MVKSTSARLDAAFHALSDPTRRSILCNLACGEQTVGEVAKPYRVSLAAVSKHLNVLARAKLISRERKGSFQIVRLTPHALQAVEQWLAGYEKFWKQTSGVQEAVPEEDSDLQTAQAKGLLRSEKTG